MVKTTSKSTKSEPDTIGPDKTMEDIRTDLEKENAEQKAKIAKLESELVTSLEAQVKDSKKSSDSGNLIPCPFKGEREPEHRVIKNPMGIVLVTLVKGDIAIGACHKGRCWFRLPLGASYQPCPVCKGEGKIDPNMLIPDTKVPLQPKDEGVA